MPLIHKDGVRDNNHPLNLSEREDGVEANVSRPPSMKSICVWLKSSLNVQLVRGFKSGQ